MQRRIKGKDTGFMAEQSIAMTGSYSLKCEEETGLTVRLGQIHGSYPREREGEEHEGKHPLECTWLRVCKLNLQW